MDSDLSFPNNIVRGSDDTPPVIVLAESIGSDAQVSAIDPKKNRGVPFYNTAESPLFKSLDEDIRVSVDGLCLTTGFKLDLCVSIAPEEIVIQEASSPKCFLLLFSTLLFPIFRSIYYFHTSAHCMPPLVLFALRIFTGDALLALSLVRLFIETKDFTPLFVHKMVFVLGAIALLQDLVLLFVYCRPQFHNVSLDDLAIVKHHADNKAITVAEAVGAEKPWPIALKRNSGKYVKKV